MGQLLRQEELVPDRVICSTAKRARATAEAVVEACGFEGELSLNHDLYSFGVDAYLELLRQLPPELHSVMIVGHNPDVEELLELLTGEYERMPTAALAHLVLPIDNWLELGDGVQGELINLWRPRDLYR